MLIEKNKNLAFRKIEGKLYIIDPKKSYLHCLDEIGTKIWELISKKISYVKLLNKLISIYDIDELTLKKDLSEFLMELKNKNLINISNE